MHLSQLKDGICFLEIYFVLFHLYFLHEKATWRFYSRRIHIDLEIVLPCFWLLLWLFPSFFWSPWKWRFKADHNAETFYKHWNKIFFFIM